MGMKDGKLEKGLEQEFAQMWGNGAERICNL